MPLVSQKLDHPALKFWFPADAVVCAVRTSAFLVSESKPLLKGQCGVCHCPAWASPVPALHPKIGRWQSRGLGGNAAPFPGCVAVVRTALWAALGPTGGCLWGGGLGVSPLSRALGSPSSRRGAGSARRLGALEGSPGALSRAHEFPPVARLPPTPQRPRSRESF